VTLSKGTNLLSQKLYVQKMGDRALPYAKYLAQVLIQFTSAAMLILANQKQPLVRHPLCSSTLRGYPFSNDKDDIGNIQFISCALSNVKFAKGILKVAGKMDYETLVKSIKSSIDTLLNDNLVLLVRVNSIKRKKTTVEEIKYEEESPPTFLPVDSIERADGRAAPEGSRIALYEKLQDESVSVAKANADNLLYKTPTGVPMTRNGLFPGDRFTSSWKAVIESTGKEELGKLLDEIIKTGKGRRLGKILASDMKPLFYHEPIDLRSTKISNKSYVDAVMKLLPVGLNEEERLELLDSMGLNLKTFGIDAVRNYLKLIATKLDSTPLVAPDIAISVDKDWRDTLTVELEVIYEGFSVITKAGMLLNSNTRDETGDGVGEGGGDGEKDSKQLSTNMSGFVENLDMKLCVLSVLMALNVRI